MRKVFGLGALVLLLSGVIFAQASGTNYRVQGGTESVIGGTATVSSGATVSISSGATLSIGGNTISTAEIGLVDGALASASAATNANEAGNWLVVTLTPKDSAGTAMATAGCAEFSFSSTATYVTVAAPTTVNTTTATGRSITALGTGVYQICWPGWDSSITAAVNYSSSGSRYLIMTKPVGGGISASSAIAWQ